VSSVTIPQINLAFQIIIIALVLGSLALRRKHKLFFHGLTMLVAVILNVVSFLLVMLPSLLGLQIIRVQPTHIVSLVTLAHGTLGLIAMILGIWLVGSWHLQSSIQGCSRKKKMMRLTRALWLIALFLGVLLYMYLYTNLMP
jgi:uncharacterized membrane protein YozB (DUF420 family)